MANLGTLTLDITAKTGNFTGPISKAERDVQRFSKTLDKLAAEGSTSVDRLQRSFKTLNIKSGLEIDSEKNKLIAAFNAIKNSGVSSSSEIKRAYAAMNSGIKDINHTSKSAIFGLDGIKGAALAAFAGVSVQQFVAQLFQAGVEAQKLKTTFNAVFGQGLGATELAFVREEANRLGLELLSTSDAYMKLAASSRNTKLEGQATKDIFSAVASAGRALSLSTDQVNGAFVAIGQIMSKGTVQSEELKGQLSERLPGAFQIAARAMGVTTAELQKMLEQGQVISEDFLPKFAIELQKTFPVGAEAMAGMSAETERLKTAWFELKKTVMENGGESLFTKAILGMKDMVVEADTFYTRMSNALSVLKQIAKHPLTAQGDPVKALPPLGKFDLNMLGGTSVEQPMLDRVMKPGNIGPIVFPVSAEQRKMQEDAAKEAEAANKRIKAAAESATKAINSQIAALKLQLETFGMTSSESKLWEMDTKGATKAQFNSAEAILTQIDALEKQKAAKEEADKKQIEDQKVIEQNLKNYQSLVKDLRTDEEKYTDELKDRIAIMEKAGVTPDADISKKIAQSGVTKSPTFSGIDSSVGGINGELGKIDLAKAELENWAILQEERIGIMQEFMDEESALYLAHEEEKQRIYEEYIDKKNQLDKLRETTMTQGMWESVQSQVQILGDAFNVLGDLTKNFAGENSAAYKAMFAIQKIFAAAMIIANTEIAAAKAPAELTVLGGLAAAQVIRATGYASAGMVAGMGLAGMAHDGINSVPQDGTWLLKKGERVSTAETSAKLDRTLEDVSKKSSGGDAPIINMYEDKSKAGTVETRTQDDRRIIDIFVADLMGDGKAQKAMSRKFGLQTVGA